jgi:hypothetical protein
MSPFKQFEQHWVDRAKATSLLLAHEENAEWVEDTMQTFAAELEDELRNVWTSSLESTPFTRIRHFLHQRRC